MESTWPIGGMLITVYFSSPSIFLNFNYYPEEVSTFVIKG